MADDGCAQAARVTGRGPAGKEHPNMSTFINARASSRQGIAALVSPVRISSVQNQARDPLWMQSRVMNARSGTLRDSEQRQRQARSCCINDRFEIRGPLWQRQVTAAPIAHTASALVIADEPQVAGEKADPVAPHRAVTLVFEMGEPIGGLYQRRSAAGYRPRQARPIGRLQETNMLT